MKIEILKTRPPFKFSELAVMDWFKVGDPEAKYCFVKIYSGLNHMRIEYNALRSDGCLCLFTNNDTVIPYESTLTLEEK